MKSRQKKQAYFNEWESFEETKSFKKFEEKEQPDAELDLKIHNKLSINRAKVLGALNFFSKTNLEKLTKGKNWTLEVWLEEKNARKSANDLDFSCGLALKRPKKETIYVKKVAGNLNKVVSNAMKVLENALRKEKRSWMRVELAAETN
jgi:hypothetical protein